MRRIIVWVILIIPLVACIENNFSPLATYTLQGNTDISIKETETPQMATLTRKLLPTGESTSTQNPFKIPSFNPSYPTLNPIDDYYYPPRGYLSPNGIWVASAVLDLEIIHISGEIIWEMNAREAYQAFGGMNWRGVQWSPDSRYLYFSRSLALDGGPIRHLYNGTGFWRLDILSGKIEEILPDLGESHEEGIARFGLSVYSLSPNGNQLAYVRLEYFPLELVILDLESKQERKLTIEGDHYGSVGDLTWSPDGNNIAYVYRYYQWDSQIPEENYYLMVIDLYTGTQKKLMDMGSPGYVTRRWNENNAIELLEYYDSRCSDVYYFDLDLGEISSMATPTPYPDIEYTCPKE
jgi:WD40 repeat protein